MAGIQGLLRVPRVERNQENGGVGRGVKVGGEEWRGEEEKKDEGKREMRVGSGGREAAAEGVMLRDETPRGFIEERKKNKKKGKGKRGERRKKRTLLRLKTNVLGEGKN